jgi:hypothetical protein
VVESHSRHLATLPSTPRPTPNSNTRSRTRAYVEFVLVDHKPRRRPGRDQPSQRCVVSPPREGVDVAPARTCSARSARKRHDRPVTPEVAFGGVRKVSCQNRRRRADTKRTHGHSSRRPAQDEAKAPRRRRHRARLRRHAEPRIVVGNLGYNALREADADALPANAGAYLSGPSSCRSLVEPSTSVKRNVTVPVGRSGRIDGSIMRRANPVRPGTGVIAKIRG